MGYKGALKKLAERLTGTHILRSLPRGVDVFNDIATALPTYRIDIVFDVGANLGQSAKTYLSRLPSAHIFCFEPISVTFDQLVQTFKDNNQVHCFQCALGSSQGMGQMLSQGTSSMNHLLDVSEIENIEEAVENVEIQKLDQFCDSYRINHINYLKIDTEGNDLEVLKGAAKMLAEQRIDLVEVEAGINPDNKYHVPLSVLKDYLELHSYYLFGFYEQMNEWPTQEPHLRRTNPVFISRHMIEMHRK